MNRQKMSVALDSCAALELGSYIINVTGLDELNRPQDYFIHEQLRANDYHSADLATQYKTKKIKPDILTAKRGCGCGLLSEDKKTYPHLERVAKMYDDITAGNLDVYITKTALYEVYGANEQKGWIKPALYNEDTKTGFIKLADDAMITKMSCKLAELYCAVGAMDQTYDTKNDTLVPSRDAYIMAQCSMMGLCCLTWNRDDFMDGKREWLRSNSIQRTNQSCGLVFDSIGSTQKSAPIPLTPDQFMRKCYAYNNSLGHLDEAIDKSVVTIPNFDLNRINEAYKRAEQELISIKGYTR